MAREVMPARALQARMRNGIFLGDHATDIETAISMLCVSVIR